jgi:hypothetical protein
MSPAVLIRKLAESGSDYVTLARQILALGNAVSFENADSIRLAAEITPDPSKKACLLQLLAELHDSDSLRLFLAEIDKYISQDRVPEDATLVAISYLAYLGSPKSLPSNLGEKLNAVLLKAATDSSPKARALKAGALSSLGGVGRLDVSVTPLLDMLIDQDPEVVGQCLYALSSIWRRALDEGANVDQHKDRVCQKLTILISSILPKLCERQQSYVSAEMHVVSESTNVLALLDPRSLSDVLPDIFATAIAMKSNYLLAIVAEALKLLPEGLHVEVLVRLATSAKLSIPDAATRLLKVV